MSKMKRKKKSLTKLNQIRAKAKKYERMKKTSVRDQHRASHMSVM